MLMTAFERLRLAPAIGQVCSRSVVKEVASTTVGASQLPVMLA
jgi:hypothetical protein